MNPPLFGIAFAVANDGHPEAVVGANTNDALAEQLSNFPYADEIGELLSKIDELVRGTRAILEWQMNYTTVRIVREGFEVHVKYPQLSLWIEQKGTVADLRQLLVEWYAFLVEHPMPD